MFMSCHINSNVNIICMFDILESLTREVPYCKAPRISHLHNLFNTMRPRLGRVWSKEILCSRYQDGASR
jgi:hypothetical protein